MTEADIIEAVNTVAFLVSVTLTIAIALRQTDRVMRHRLLHKGPPQLLIRDIVFFWALAIVFLVPAIFGMFGEIVSDKLWWVILRSVIGIVALSVFAWYEYVVIGRRESDDVTGHGDDD